MSSTTGRRRRAAVIGAAIAAVTLAGACGKDGKAARPFANSNLAAEVGDERISIDTLTASVEAGMKAVEAAKAEGAQPKTGEELTRETLTRNVRLLLFRQQAKRLGVTPSAADLDKTRKEFEAQTQAGGGLEKAAGAQGIVQDGINELVELVTLDRMLAEKLVKDSPISDEELRTLYEENAAELDTARPAHILVKSESLAKKILARVKAGEDFATLAKKYSIDTANKDKGGDLDTGPRGRFVPEFDKAVFDAKAGDVVGPVKTEFGFHIIKVLERATFESSKEAIRAQAGPTIGHERLLAEINKAVAGGLRINPRFGRWDDKGFEVVAPDSTDSPSSPTAPPTDPAAPAATPTQ